MPRHGSELAVSAEAVVAVSPDLRVVSWNAAAARLTGIEAAKALGQPCWRVLCNHDCAARRYAGRGLGVPRQEVQVRTPAGTRTLSVSTIIVRDGAQPLILHLLQEAGDSGTSRAARNGGEATLTTRQRQVLRLLADGVSARGVAQRLGIAETTARNHIRAVLSAFHAHSQLEAVARARAQGLV
jgi:DNA-binding CsgD family transcriptional regulator